MGKSNQKENILVRIAKYLFPWRGDRPAEVIRKIIFLSAAIVLVVTVSMMLTDKLQRAATNKRDEERAELFHKVTSETANSTPDSNATSDSGTSGETSSVNEAPEDPYAAVPAREVQEKFKPFIEQNPETIGWITIYGKGESSPWLDYVVMQTTDNDKYLSTNFEGNYSRSGTLFVDYADKITPTSEPANIVVYGHNMASGEYFGQLPLYFNYRTGSTDTNDISFYKTHPTVEFSTLYKTSTYKIFAAMMVNTEEDAGDVFAYHVKHNFSGKADFNNFVAEILDRSSFYNPDVNVQYGDRLLTLSTCINITSGTEQRFVLFAREVRSGESPEVDVSKAYANPNPKFFDEYYKEHNYTWNGRKWDKNLLVGYED